MSYVIDVYQDFLEDEKVPGLRNVEGFISGLDEAQLEDLVGQDLTLLLADGRKLDLALDFNGQIIPRGPLS